MGPNRYLHFIICFVYYCLELPLIKYALKTILPPVSILLHISFALLWQTTHKSGKPRSSIVKTFNSPLDIHNCIRLIVVKLRGPNRYLHLRKCFVWNCCLKLLLKSMPWRQTFPVALHVAFCRQKRERYPMCCVCQYPLFFFGRPVDLTFLHLLLSVWARIIGFILHYIWKYLEGFRRVLQHIDSFTDNSWLTY